MWGEVGRHLRNTDSIRITPTSVGRSLGTDLDIKFDSGLPPPVWGEGSQLNYIFISIRITPTSVGRSGKSAPGVETK